MMIILLKAIIYSFLILSIIGFFNKPYSIYENNKSEKNPLEGKMVKFVEDENDAENADGVKGHLEVIGDSSYKPSFYERYTKRLVDILLSFFAMLFLFPLLLVLTILLYIDDPGPILFTQKRIGKNKKYFRLHKFRSMKMSTPHDVPTHMLENPEHYITKIGKFIRQTSLDELPQIWDIFIGNMSIIGPRPALWNQDLLTAERDKYNVNNLVPGLTGWAQINGRDAIVIPEKAKLDGHYLSIINKGGINALVFDVKCLLGTILPVARHEGFKEGKESNN